MVCGYVYVVMMKQEPNNNDRPTGMVDGPRLLEDVFPNPLCRPSVRWLRAKPRGAYCFAFGDRQRLAPILLLWAGRSRAALPMVECSRLGSMFPK